MRRFIDIVEDAWHGSPHRFNKFSTDHIGTGEGHARFGWGLYFASKPEVAEFYRKSLTKQFTYKGRAVDPESWLHSAIYALVYNDGDKEAAKHPWKPTSKVYELIDKIDYAKIRLRASVYHVDIPDDTEFLLWDAAFFEQSPVVQTALRHLIQFPAEVAMRAERQKGVEPWRVWEEYLAARDRALTGEELYQTVSVQHGGDQKASLALLARGVHGIKYLDGGSRDTGEGSFNYVIFDADRAKIKRRDDGR